MSIPPSDSSNGAGSAARLRIVASLHDVTKVAVGATAPTGTTAASTVVRREPPQIFNPLNATRFTPANLAQLRADVTVWVRAAYRAQGFQMDDRVVAGVVNSLTDLDVPPDILQVKLRQIAMLREFDPSNTSNPASG